MPEPPLLGLLLVLLVTTSCSVFDPKFEAVTPGPSGAPPAVVEVDYRGNDGIASRRLHQRINEYMLDLSREPSNEAAVFDAQLELEDFYREQGYPDVTIGYEVAPAAPKARTKAGAAAGAGGAAGSGEEARGGTGAGTSAAETEAAPPTSTQERPHEVKVTFHITEGPRVLITDLAIEGNHAFSDEELLPLWTRRASGVLGFGEPLFVLAQLEAFASAITTFYKSRGYDDVVVKGPIIERRDRKAQVRYAVEEGPLYRIAVVEVGENIRAALGGKLPPPPIGQPHSTLRQQEYFMALRAALRARGYPDPRLRMQSKPHEGNAASEPPPGTATPPNEGAHAPAPHRDLRYFGEPGNKRTVSEVVLRGNEETADWVIRDKYPLHAGDLFDGSAEDEALRQLYKTGLFRRVRIEHEPVGEDRVRILVTVEELDSRTFDLLAGYGSYERLRGGFRIAENNLFGTGRSVALEGRASLKGYRGALTFTDRDLFGTDTELSIQLDAFRREEPSFVDRAGGLTIGLGRDLTNHIQARLGYTLRTHTGTKFDVLDPAAQLTEYTEGIVFAELRNDHRNDLLFPSDGHREYVRADFMDNAFGATVGFVRLTLGGSIWFEMGKDWVFALNSTQRVLFPEQGSDRVPIPERLFLGGEDSVRAFHEDMLGPKDIHGVPRGGEYSNLFNVELRFPIYRALHGAVFGDAGNVGSDARQFGLNGMRFAVGGGLRLALPIGPVRIDAAWNPDQTPLDPSYAVHISVGYPF